MTEVGLYSRLKDPSNILTNDELRAFNNKVSEAQALLIRRPSGGGNPFVYAMSVSKTHIVTEALPGRVGHVLDRCPKCKEAVGPDDLDRWGVHHKACGGKVYTGWDTAATDGVHYYWHPSFLSRISPPTIAMIMEHETYHILFDHAARGVSRNMFAWDAAVDYVVNGTIIEHRSQAEWRETKERVMDALFAELLPPMPLNTLLDHLKNNTNPFVGKFANGFSLGDPSVYGMSPDEIYDMIMQHMPKHACGSTASAASGGAGGDPCPHCGALGNTNDAHIDLKVSRQQVMTDAMRAADHVKMAHGAGTVPGFVQDVIGQLSRPQLSVRDLVRNALYRRRHDRGDERDYRRFRRRALAMEEFIPRNFEYVPRWLCMLDTSGSMSPDDMALGVSQLMPLSRVGEGVVVPCDAVPHWEHATKISNMADITSIRPVGRGGTLFKDFFRDYKKMLGGEFDLIVILTDGDMYERDLPKPAGTDVLWVITNNRKEFKPPFGRVAHLTPRSM